MTSPSNPPLSLPTRTFAVVALALATALAGCGDKKDKATARPRRKVNKEEITASQINQVLQQQRAASRRPGGLGEQRHPRAADRPGARLQKASDLKLDRDPRVMQAIEASRREIIARAYVEKVGEGAPKPLPKDSRTTTPSIPRSSRRAGSTTSRRSTSRRRRRRSRS
jgi:EpsD family peptidyl-prolyl cis-trans isomerase